jgi:hypothetical protein
MVACRATTIAAVFLAAVAAAHVAVASASDEPARNRTISSSPLLWATVNVCDTVDRPNMIGIRASMPGSGIRDERMFVRFQVQFKAPKDGLWHNVGSAGDSGFVDIGSGRYKARQVGRNFTILPPEGTEYRLRGAVTFEWRLDGEVVRRARKRTTGGHRNTRGSDPKGFSAATCVVR